jgi:hypothetical protein
MGLARPVMGVHCPRFLTGTPQQYTLRCLSDVHRLREGLPVVRLIPKSGVLWQVLNLLTAPRGWKTLAATGSMRLAVAAGRKKRIAAAVCVELVRVSLAV